MIASLALTASALSTLVSLTSAQSYAISESWSGDNFINGWNWFTSGDPSGGWVTYVDQGTADAAGYYQVINGQVNIGVDTQSIVPVGGPGRQAVRIVSNTAYNHGLFIGDFSHMAGGVCGVWPSWWMVGPNWPAGGEMDIIEGVNNNVNNAATAHTAQYCTTDGAGSQSVLNTGDCNQGNGDPAEPTTGCSYTNQDTTSYGSGFNNNGGGVYAMEWSSSNISTYYFPRNAIPEDITMGCPDPTQWGEPQTVIATDAGCNVDQYFTNMQMVINTDFCGGWADGLWGSSGCSQYADSCEDYVANNPSAFEDAYWAINSINVYTIQDDGVEEEIVPLTATNTQTALASVSPAAAALKFAGAAMGNASVAATGTAGSHHHTHTYTGHWGGPTHKA